MRSSETNENERKRNETESDMIFRVVEGQRESLCADIVAKRKPKDKKDGQKELGSMNVSSDSESRDDKRRLIMYYKYILPSSACPGSKHSSLK